MQRVLLLSFVLLPGALLSSTAARAQVSVIVNADGSHSVLHQSGSTGVLVNPDGSHTVVPNADSNPTVVVNPNGTHSVLHRTGPAAVLVNPDVPDSPAAVRQRARQRGQRQAALPRRERQSRQNKP